MKTKILYIDKANSVDDIRIAEKSIWVDEMPLFNYKVDCLLFQNTRENSCDSKTITIRHYKYRVFSYASLIFKLFKYVWKERPFLLVVRNVVDLGLVSCFISKIFGVELLYIKAFPYLEFKKRRTKGVRRKFIEWLIKLEVFLMSRANHLIVRSERFRTTLKDEYGLDRKDIIIVPMGINLNMLKMVTNTRRQQLKERHNLQNEYCGIYFGALDKSRGIDFMIEGLAAVSAQKPNFDFLIVGGDEHEVERLRKVSEMYRINITFLGSVKREELFELIQLADFSLSVIPPIDEYILSSPTKVVESLAFGCPVIVNKEIDDQNEIIVSSKGGVIIEYNQQEFNRVLNNVLSGKYDLDSMGRAGRKYVLAQRSYSTMAKKIIENFR